MERWQGERFEFVRRIGKIFVSMLVGICSKEAGQLWLTSDCCILVMR